MRKRRGKVDDDGDGKVSGNGGVERLSERSHCCIKVRIRYDGSTP
jgi:hypothetical protein